MRAEAVQFRAKREGGFDQRKEQEGSTHQLYPTQDFLIADHVWVCPDVIPSREVWLQQAQLLTEQVCLPNVSQYRGAHMANSKGP